MVQLRGRFQNGFGAVTVQLRSSCSKVKRRLGPYVHPNSCVDEIQANGSVY